MATEEIELAAFDAMLRMDLSAFIQKSFDTVDPGSPYRHNWHIDAIAYHLEQVERGKINRLIITMPPRSLKSISASVAFPAWYLGRHPKKRILAVSYAESLSEKLALDCQKVMQAPWYQNCFPGTRISKSRRARHDFETTLGGGRYSTSVSGAVTGRGGDIILIDDPHKPEDANSDVKRSAVIEWFRSTLLSRLNDPARDAIVLIQQRVHEDDLAGMLLRRGGWIHLNLPAIAEEEMVVEISSDLKKYRKEGGLLHPERLPGDLLERRREELGSYVFAAQYQQRPAPLGGGIVKWAWFKRHETSPERRSGDLIVQSWDTASTADEASDYSVCTTWLVKSRQNAWLLDVYREKLEFPDLRRQVQREADNWKSDLILIEHAGSGIQLIQELKPTMYCSIRGMKPKLDKETRMMSVTLAIEGGKVSIPREARWLADFQHEVVRFPKARHDDQVDSLSQFLTWLTERRATAVYGTYG